MAAGLVKKSVAIGIAGLTTLVVAVWRQIQRDNTLDTDPAPDGAGQPGTGQEPAGRADGTRTAAGNVSEQESPRTAAGASRPDASAGSALFTPSIDENSTKAELYAVATELEIPGRSKMNKSDLLAAIRSAR